MSFNLNDVNLISHGNEGEGIITADSSGKGNNGTLIGTTWNTINPKLGPACFSYDGFNDYNTYGAGSSLDAGAGDLTIAQWINTTQEDRGSLVRKANGTAKGYFTDINQELHPDKLFCSVFDGIKFKQYVSLVDINDGLWHLAVMVWLAATQTLLIYIDNVEGHFAAFDNGGVVGNLDVAEDFETGRDHVVGGRRFYEDLQDEVIFAKRGFTVDDIDFLWNGGAGREIGAGGRRRRMLVSRPGR